MAYEEKEAAKADDDKEILKKARDYLKECVDEESEERAKMQDDLRFASLDQWPAEIRKERESDIENGPRPCLTIDKLNQYLVQVVNDVRQGRPGINVRPQDDAADVETAKLLKGLVRNIEDQSKADIAYATAVESAAKIGVGYFRITTEYVDDQSFDQEIFIRPIANTFSVYLGKHIMPDGSDAEHGFIAESMPEAKFKELHPKAKMSKEDFDDLPAESKGYWRTEDMITVVEFYCLERVREELYFLDDGTTIGAADYEKWPETAGPRPEIQDRRWTTRKQLKWRKMTGVEVLEKRDLPGQFVPIVEVVGREAWVDGKRILWGLVRPAKDSLRMYNYWASTITERMALAPKVPYLIAEGQIEGHEPEWKTANRINRAALTYKAIDVNGTLVPPPQRVGPTPVEAALIQHQQVIEHDVQTSLGIFKAGIGESESQQSGRAILALQRESDTGTYHFGANLGVSIRHAGRIIVDLIPHYYDTRRIVRILGEDGEVQTATLDPDLGVPYQQTQGGATFNPGLGKYDVSITVGPSYNTKRMEAAATFVELAKGAADPMSAAVMRYLTVRNSDFSGADEAAKMLRALIPPQVLQAVQGDQQIPPAAQAQLMQAQQMMQAAQQKIAELESGAAQQQKKIAADHDAKMKQIELNRQVAAAEIKAAREKSEAEFDLEVWKAERKVELERICARADQEREEDRFTLEKDKHEREAALERDEKMKDEEASAMPQMMKMMTEMMQTFTQSLSDVNQSNQQGLALLAEAIKNPPTRTIKMRTDSGTQATATIN